MNRYETNKELDDLGKKIKDEMVWEDKPNIKFLMKVTDKSEFIGQISKVTGKWKFLTEYDYVVEVWNEYWEKASAGQKEAVIYHELCHVLCEIDDDGNTRWNLKKHDIEEFKAVVQRYGVYRPSIEEFMNCLNPPAEEVKIEEVNNA